MNEVSIRELIQGAKEGEKFPLARLISELEKKEALQFRKKLFPILAEEGLSDETCLTLGITGTPGAGKSSLIGALCYSFLKEAGSKKLAIVAIDPSSHISGGSILGDRTRVILPPRENRIFFRSQASQLEMGGVNPYTYHVIRLLRHLFDYVIIETVGIGQNETEVTNLADFSFLVMQPLGGDQIQFMKSGIMEVPDAFIINKCDEKELASASYHTLLASLEFLHDTLNQKEVPDIFLSSVTKNLGIEELMAYILTITHKKSRKEEMLHQLKRWIRNEYGNLGLKYFTPFYSNRENASFETLEADFNKHFLSLFHSY